MDESNVQHKAEAAGFSGGQPGSTARDGVIHGDKSESSESAEEWIERDDPGRPSRIAAWLLIVGSFALLAFFVAVPAHTYVAVERQNLIYAVLDVREIELVEIWRVQINNLPVVEYESLLQIFFVASGVVAVLGSAGLIWLATVEIVPTTRSAVVPEGESVDILPPR